jgi:uncharacterized cupredoxin-like copper-binding protein
MKSLKSRLNSSLRQFISISAFLVIFMFFAALAIWSLDFVAHQSTFALLVAAELVAFALLTYLYYEENPNTVERRWLLSGFAAIGVLTVLAAAMFVGVSSTPQPTVEMSIYGGEVSGSVYGFGNSSTSITSPGPKLTFKVGDVVKMTLNNAGKMPHNWALTTSNVTDTTVLFNAVIASDTTPLQSGQSGSVTFKVTQAGNFYYVCQVAGHLELGMWGEVTINP